MNVHFPQDEISRAEAMNIVDANAQYIGPRSGDAVRGLIQVYYACSHSKKKYRHNCDILILLLTVIIEYTFKLLVQQFSVKCVYAHY